MYKHNRKTGFTTYSVALIQNAWTQIVTHSHRRCALHLQPTNSNFAITFGETKPTVNITLPDTPQYTPNTLTDEHSPALVKGSVWGWTSVAGNMVLVTEEMNDEELNYDR